MAGAEEGQVVLNHAFTDLPPYLQGLAGTFIGFLQRKKQFVQANALLNALVTNNDAAAHAVIPTIDDAVMTILADQQMTTLLDLWVLRRQPILPLPPAAAAPLPQKESVRLAIAPAHAHFNAFRGMYPPQIANLFQASFDQNTLACSSIRSKAGGYLLSCLIRILTCVNV